MNLHEIIHRHESLPIHEEEMKFVVKEFIYLKTGKSIEIDLQKSSSWINFFPQKQYIDQVNKLTVAFALACVELKKQ